MTNQSVNISIVFCMLFILTGCSKPQDTDAQATQQSQETQQLAANDIESLETADLSSIDLPDYLNRDIQNEIFYFVMPDRFHNGNPENDNGDPSRANFIRWF